MRPIDADALKENINNLTYENKNSYSQEGGNEVLHYFLPKIIDDEPTIEAEPVKHGRWKSASRWMVEQCSACGFEIGTVLAVKCNWCPNCGAKMDGGDPNEEP